MNLENGVLQVHIEDIIPNRFQPRLNFDEQGLKELSDSIKEHGIIQPLVLRKLGNKYEIIAGERRYKAAQMAGLTTVPAVIANIDDNKSAEVALVENIQRRDLTAIEEAISYKNLLDKGYLTQEQLAKRMGLSQPAVANKLRLLNLDEEVQQALLDEKISERHARTLLTLNDKNAQKEWLHRIINERLTVRQLDMELKKLKSKKTEEEENEIPIVDSFPSIDDIRARAVDINQINKMTSQNQNKLEDNKPTEILETLDEPLVNENEKDNNDVVETLGEEELINPIQPEEETTNETIKDETAIDPLNPSESEFTTATSIPDFNIATPNSASTLINDEPLEEQDNKFFNFNDTPDDPTESFTPAIPESLNANKNEEFEVFDVTENNKFVDESNNAGPENDAPVPPKGEDLSKDNEKTSLNTPFDTNPNNRFFTPVTENNEIEIESKQDEIVDPMEVAEIIAENKPEVKEQKKEMGLKDAINNIRKCIRELGDDGFYINVEEIDFDENYQITIQINKDN